MQLVLSSADNILLREVHYFCAQLLESVALETAQIPSSRDSYVAYSAVQADLVRVGPGNIVTVAIRDGQPVVLQMVGARTTTPKVLIAA